MSPSFDASFLRGAGVALAGAARDGRSFGSVLLRELLARGVRVLPLHPQADSLEGQPCLPGPEALEPDVEALVVCLPPAHANPLLRRAAGSGICRVWLQPSSTNAETVQLAQALGLEAVHGRCLLMHLPPVGGIHGIHRVLARLTGKDVEPLELPRQHGPQLL